MKQHYTMDPQRQPVLSKETLVPIGSIVMLAGAVFYIVNLSAQVGVQGDQIARLQTEVSKYADLSDRMARIETKIDILIDNKK
jgi:hypothetical protein